MATSDLELILIGKTTTEQDLILQGIGHPGDGLSLILTGITALDDDLSISLDTKPYDEQGIITGGPKTQSECGILLKSIEVSRKRLALLDIINLRTTAVYRNPRDISYLSIICGDFSRTKIPCTPLDKDGYLYHASDLPMQSISQVYVEGSPQTFGYVAYPAYQDETGRSVAIVKFDEPQYDKQVSISGKGAMNLDTGELIENPAQLVSLILLNVQGYDEDAIDAGEMSRFYADCLLEEIKVACVLNSPVTIKDFFDELSLNIHSHWMISDGKSVMRLKWL